MARERQEVEAREQQKRTASQATAMVDGGGGWLECERLQSIRIIADFHLSL